MYSFQRLFGFKVRPDYSFQLDKANQWHASKILIDICYQDKDDYSDIEESSCVHALGAHYIISL